MTTPVIECRHLWKIFGKRADSAMQAVLNQGLDKTQVNEQFDCIVGVQDATFSVSKGEIFCIMGLSGSGKSTLLRHVNRLIEPTSGEILIEGENVNRLNANELRQLRSTKIGMVFQNMALLPHRNVRDNVALSLELRKIEQKKREAIADEAIATVELSGWETRYIDELSGGMQQRVGLARAIAADPQILLMDEPFSALDPLIRQQLQDQFIALAGKMRKTTLFITHDLDEAIRIGQRIAIMKDGVLVQVGTPEEIVTNPADDYVKKFVAGISNLHLIRAARIMQPLDAYQQQQPINVAACIGVRPDDDLDQLITIFVDNEGPVVVKEVDATVIGVINKKMLLQGIQGRWGEAHQPPSD